MSRSDNLVCYAFSTPRAFIPLLAPDAGEADYLVPEEALVQGKVEITEVSEGERGSEIKIIDNSAIFGPDENVRGEGPFVLWAALVLDGRVLHLSAFASMAQDKGGFGVPFQRFSQRRRIIIF